MQWHTYEQQLTGLVPYVDGDGAIFQDVLFKLGKEAGAEAAHRLHAAIQEEVKATYPDAISDWSIMVQVVLNIQGLVIKLLSLGIISNANDLAEFGRAFGTPKISLQNPFGNPGCPVG